MGLRRLGRIAVCSFLAMTTTSCESRPTAVLPEYAALGDSYTAGPLIGRADDRNGCVRSTNNYPHLLAAEAKLLLTDVSCSAAETSAVEGKQKVRGRNLAPQIDAVKATTDLVTVGLGLNDLNLSVRIFITCVELGATDPEGAPCTEADRDAGPGGVQSALDQIESRIESVVDAVAERAPDAQIVLVGYPSILPEQGTCSELGIAAGDVPLMRHIVESINTAQAKVAEERGATYLDTATPSRGHDICADDPWIAGRAPAPGRPGIAWHPYAEEQAMVATLLAGVLEDQPL